YDIEESATQAGGGFFVSATSNVTFEEEYDGSATFGGSVHFGYGLFDGSVSGDGDRTDVNDGYYSTVRKDYRDGESSYHYESSGAGGGKSVETNSSVTANF